MQTKYLILILGLLIVILAHGDRGRKAGGSGRYIKSILGIENGNGRRIKGYDYIRVLAVIAVIGTHVVQSDTQLSAGSPGWIGLRIAETAFLTCNVLFVMLSGALLLNRGKNLSRPFIGNGSFGSSFPWRSTICSTSIWDSIIPGCLIRQTGLTREGVFFPAPRTGTRISG